MGQPTSRRGWISRCSAMVVGRDHDTIVVDSDTPSPISRRYFFAKRKLPSRVRVAIDQGMPRSMRS